MINTVSNDLKELKKKILVVSSAFYPENSARSFRATELVKRFALQGHDVTVYTVKNNEVHIPFEKKHKVTIKDLGKRKFTEIDIKNSSRYVTLIKRAFRRALNLFFEYPDIELMFKVKSKLRNENGYDLLITVAVPHPNHWGAAWARTKKNPVAHTWVADCGDPYMGNKHDSFNKLFYFKYLEKWFCKKADYISITKEGFKINYYKEFWNKLVTISQGFDFGEIDIIKKEPENKVPTFAFAGTLMRGSRDPGKLLNYLAAVDKPFKLIFYTQQKDLIEPYFELLKDKVEVRKIIPRDKLIPKLSEMDFLVNLEYDPLTQSPSKLIDYALTGRPTLSLESDNFDEKLVDEFLAGDYTRQFKLDNFEQYDIENVTKKFLSLASK